MNTLDDICAIKIETCFSLISDAASGTMPSNRLKCSLRSFVGRVANDALGELDSYDCDLSDCLRSIFVVMHKISSGQDNWQIGSEIYASVEIIENFCLLGSSILRNGLKSSDYLTDSANNCVC